MKKESRLKAIYPKLLLTGTSLLVLIGLVLGLELGLRLFAPQPPRGFSDNLFEKRDGMTYLIPGATGTQYSREFNVKIAGNSQGYRSGTWGGQADIDSTLWLFGDSFAFGWGVEADETVAALLNGDGIRCIDFGMPGDNFKKYIARLSRIVATGKHPSAILLLIYDNDFHLHDLPRRWSSNSANVTPESILMNVVPELKYRNYLLKSHVIRLLGRMLDMLGLSDLLASLSGYQAARLDLVQTFLPIHRRSYVGTDEFTQSCGDFRKFIGIARGVTDRVTIIRIQPLYITGSKNQLSSIQLIHDDPAKYDFSEPDNHLQDLCADSGVSYTTFNVKEGKDPLEYYYRYDMHLNPAGHRLLAEFCKKSLGLD